MTTTSQRSPSTERRSLLALAGITLLVFVGAVFLDGNARIWSQVVLLGIVEGVTEFLPISSTGHLLLASSLLRFEHNIGGTFEIFIQLGAIVAVLAFYSRDILGKLQTIPSSASSRRFWISLAIAFLPAAIVGLLLRKWIKAVLFASPTVIASSLIIGGIVLIVIERWQRAAATTHTLEAVTFRQALAIGCAQVFSLVPGVSRSGASMVGGMLAGLDRPTATAFSFYLAIPTLGAATIVDLLGSLDQITTADIGYLLVGTIVSGVVAWLSMAWLLRYIARHQFTAFGVYRILAGIVVLALVALHVIT